MKMENIAAILDGENKDPRFQKGPHILDCSIFNCPFETENTKP